MMRNLNRSIYLAGFMVLSLIAGEISAEVSSAPPQDSKLTIVENSKPAATIVVSAEPSHAALFAARELCEHIKKISGADLPVVTDKEKVQGCRILVGESEATRQLGLKNSDFKPQEFMIRFLPDTLVLMGYDGESQAEVHGTFQWGEGKFGSALEFNKANPGVVIVPSGFSDDSGSLEAWLRIPDTNDGANGSILRQGCAIPTSWWNSHWVRLEKGKLVYIASWSFTKASQPKTELCSAKVSSREVLTPGWHHFLATHSLADRKLELFVDGISQGTAQYAKPSVCAGGPLQIGGYFSDQRMLARFAFTGRIAEIRVSQSIRKPVDTANAPYRSDADTACLVHADEGCGVPGYKCGNASAVPLPKPFYDQGTCYAVYDFLERFCGVRWYAPTELGMVLPSLPTLAVGGREIRRQPAMRYRHLNALMPKGMGESLWNHPKESDVALFFCRLRMGGEKYLCTHSFEGYYDRFWKKNSQCPEVFEGEHPEYFAQGRPDEGGNPPQLCYSSPDVVRQVVRDARDYFDGKGLKHGADAAGDYFALESMDNSHYCRCPNCTQLYAETAYKAPPDGACGWSHYARNTYSDYWFGFVNKVAKEIKKSHPNKYIATLAYGYHQCHPSFPLEPNIAVQMCLATLHWECFPHQSDFERQVYQSWLADSKQRGLPLYIWTYSFPERMEYVGPEDKRFKVFPGFSAHADAQQIKMFARDGIRGAYIEAGGFCDPINRYLTFKLMDDPSLDTDAVLDEFFTRYYGAASKPMKELYLAIEGTFSQPENYPEVVRKQTEWEFEQTEEMAWGYLGTEKRMAEFGKHMEQAKSAAVTDTDKKRVELFEKGVWEHMLKGRKNYLDKNDPAVVEKQKQKEADRDKLKAEPLPSTTIPAGKQDSLIDPPKGKL